MEGIADFEFIRPLGVGNHGTFWLATTPERLGITDEHVAVKTLLNQATDADFKRMANELRLYASVSSPDLVPLFDAGQSGGVLFYASKYYVDGSLAQPARPFSRSAVLRAVAGAANGAHALHEVGIAHRDIKPGNIMLEADGATSTGQLGDLGLAQILNPGQTVTGIGPVGAVEYLAPESVRGDAASRASDVWALGVSLHRGLVGRSVFPSIPEDSLLEALRHVLHATPELDPTLSAGERAIVERALEPEPSHRYSTAAEFAADVSAEAERIGAAS